MKKQIALVAGLAVLAAPAFASKARLQALGEDVNGSFYINDNRNIFLNAAEVNNHKDLVTFEIGADDNEGGLFRAHGNMVYGVQFGRSNGFNDSLSNLDGSDLGAGESLNTFKASNNLELFVGGDAGIKWGAKLGYSQQKDDAFEQDDNDDSDLAKAKTSAIDISLGVSQGNWSAFANVGISGETTHEDGVVLSDGKIERETAIDLGGSYQLNEYTLFARYSTDGYKVTEAGGDIADVTAKSLQVGAGRSSKLNDKATLFTRVSYNMSEQEDKEAGSEDNSTFIPVVVGLELDASSWLTLRGSVTQNVIINENETKTGTGASTVKSTPSSTVVAAGASLKFGDLTVDGLISNTDGTVAPTDSGTIDSSNLMTRVSMTYRF